MRIRFFNTCAVALCVVAPFVALNAADADANAEKIARMEARLAELEARLAENEQTTKEVQVMATNRGGAEGNGALRNAATYDIMSDNAWRNLRWTQEGQWKSIRNGMTEDQVIEYLGSPPRTVKSVKPRVDEVYFYETSIRDRSNSLKGRISFKDGKVVSFQKPNFKSQGQSK